MQELEKIWMNGELVDWADAKVHVGTHGLHYGSGVFEGIRAYDTAKGSAVFRLTDHLKRLDNSARLLNMELGYTLPELLERELLRHPLVWAGAGSTNHLVGLSPLDIARVTRAEVTDLSEA